VDWAAPRETEPFVNNSPGSKVMGCPEHAGWRGRTNSPAGELLSIFEKRRADLRALPTTVFDESAVAEIKDHRACHHKYQDRSADYLDKKPHEINARLLEHKLVIGVRQAKAGAFGLKGLAWPTLTLRNVNASRG
jgi:hypothetical protein